MQDDVDISTLTIEQYLALIRDDIRPGVVKPEISNGVEFEINSNFMRELRHKYFAGTDDEDAYEHVWRVFEIIDVFHFPGVTHDAVMLRLFPITLKGRALRWKKRLPAGVINTWDLLEKEFIWQYCSPYAHLTKEYPLKKEDKAVEQSNYMRSLEETIIKFYEESIKKHTADDEWIRKSIENTDSNIRELRTTTKYLQEKAYQLTQIVLINIEKKNNNSPYRNRKTVCMIENHGEVHKIKAQEDEGGMDVVQPYMSLGPVHDKEEIVREEEQDYVNTARQVNAAHTKTTVNAARSMSYLSKIAHSTVKRSIHKNTAFKNSNPQIDLQDKGVIDSGCSRHMTRNMSYLTYYEEIDGGYVAFGGNPKGGKITGKALGFMRPFGCPVTILNTIDHLGKFDAKADEGFFVGYSINSKAFRAFNSRTRIVEENLHVYSKSSLDVGFKPSGDDEKKVTEEPRKEGGYPSKEDERDDQDKDASVNSTNNVNAASTNEVNDVGRKASFELPDEPNMPALEDIIYSDDDKEVGTEADMNNLDAFMHVCPIPTIRVHKDHPVEKIIGDLNLEPQTRRMTKNLEERGLFSSVQQRTNHKDFQSYLFSCFLSQVEPKKVIQALQDPSLIKAMQDKLIQFKLQKVWTLVDLPNDKRPIGTKWVFRNKKDERGIVIKNKVRLVNQWYTQEEGIDYDNEVYVCQPPGFEDPNFPDRRGKIDKTLFIKRNKGDILLVQVYVDDIIFGSTKKSLCTEFEKMMHKKFQMSSIGELTFFLGLQVKQKEDGIFISQDKYVTEILKKFGFTDVKTVSTPMETHKLLLKDEDGEEVDVHLYRSMIGSLMYLTSLRPDIMFAVCACARYQVNPKVSHLHAVKMIFRYLKGQPKLGLWYLKDSPFDLVAYTVSDYDVESLDRKSTTGGCQFLGSRLISWQCKKQTVVENSTTEAEYVAASSCHGQAKTVNEEVQLQALVDGKKVIITESTVRRDLQLEDAEATNQKFNFSKYIFESIVKNLENVTGKFLMYPRFVQVFLEKQLEGMSNHKRIYVTPSHTKKIFGNMRRVGKGFSGRETPLFQTMVVQHQEEMGEGSANPTDPHHTPIIIQPSTTQPQKKQRTRRSKRKDTEATPNEPSFPGTSSGGGPRRQETIGDTVAKTRSKNLSKLLNDPLLEITSLKRRVKRLEEKGRSRTHGLKRLYKVGLSRRVESSYEEGLGEEDASKQGRIADIDADAGINLVITHFDADTDMFGVYDLVGDEVVVEREVVVKAASIIPVSVATTTITVITNDDITLAKELSQLKSAKLPTTTASTTIIVMSTRPRAKGLARVEADYQLAQRLQAQEQEELTDEEKARLFVQFLEQRRKHFAAKRAEEKRNRPPTSAQQRSFMCTYLKNMEGWKPKDLKNKSFVIIQELFDKAMKRANTFVDYKTELVEESSKKAKAEIAQESSSKRAGTKLKQESIKKQKVDEDKETVELQRLIEVLPDKRGSSN
ncbi:putative ribonuclease H-like domain-containing protein [Tanacetum coccineum]